MTRNHAYRRHQTERHLARRLIEDRNQHYNDLACPCYSDAKTIARFKEQPKRCSCPFCGGSPRRYHKGTLRFTIQERRHNH